MIFLDNGPAAMRIDSLRIRYNHTTARGGFLRAGEPIGGPGQTARVEASNFKRKLLGLMYNSLYFVSALSLSPGVARTKVCCRMRGAVLSVFLKNLHNWRSDP